jgi:lipopolysaccharide/colanic/teichoic acid biosynthesis glycosyltransferase
MTKCIYTFKYENFFTENRLHHWLKNLFGLHSSSWLMCYAMIVMLHILLVKNISDGLPLVYKKVSTMHIKSRVYIYKKLCVCI